MRHYILALIAFMGLAFSSNAFTPDDYNTNSKSKLKTTLVIDFSNASVDGLPLTDYLNDINHTDAFDYEIKKYYADFIERFNDNCKSLAVTRSKDCKITLTVKVTDINRKGNEAICDYVFTDNETGEELLVITERTRESRFGSFSNLVGDVMREAGGEFAGTMNKYFKKEKKNKK